jgi:small conductance mechanosensitive channel
MWNRLFDGPERWQLVAIVIGAVVVLAWIGAGIARRLAAAAIRAVLPDTVAPTSPLVQRPLRMVWIASFALLAALLVFPGFEVVGLRPRTGVQLSTMADWVFAAGLRVILIAAIATALVRMVAIVVKRFEHELTLGTTLDALERAKRARTLGAVISKGATAIIVGMAGLMILRELHVDIAPVLTGAGIVGLAIGFGAQSLVKDIIGGFFLILEDQVRVGDVVTVNGVGGLVEELNLRTIVLRDQEGAVHVFPNGSITALTNRSKDYSYYVIDLAVSYQQDPDRMMDLLRKMGAELQADSTYGPFILEPVEVLGVDAFGDWGMTIKARIKTVPLKQWDVGRELRRRITKTLDELGIEMPYPALRPRPPQPRPEDTRPSVP